MTGRRDTSGWDMDTTRLRDAVERFADAPQAGAEPSPTPPPELMLTLRRRQRVSRRLPAMAPPLAAALTTASIVIGIVVGLPVLLPDARQPSSPADAGRPVPAPSELVGAIPQVVPRPETASERDRAPGVAAAIAFGEDLGLFPWQSRDDYAALSATDGTWTWLGLDDEAGDVLDPRLSPTGRYIAYWVYEERDPDIGSVAQRFVTRDLVTGADAVFEPPATPLGAFEEGPQWVDATTVYTAFSRVVGLGRGQGTTHLTVDASSGRVSMPPPGALSDPWLSPIVHPGFADDGQDGVLTAYHADGTTTEAVAPPERRSSSLQWVGLSPGATTVVDQPRGGQTLHVYPAQPVGEALPEPRRLTIDGWDLNWLIGWVDDDHVVALASREPMGRDVALSIDLRTGESEEIARGAVRFSNFASGLWQKPTETRARSEASGGWDLGDVIVVLVGGLAAAALARMLVGGSRQRRREVGDARAGS